MATAPVERARASLSQRFPGLRMQVSSCRKIARSNTWSQHAFDNAIDIFASRQTLDMVAGFLRSNKGQLSINNILWQVRDHYDHVHVDFYPKGIGKPVCAGGPGIFTGEDTGGDPVGDPGGTGGADWGFLGGFVDVVTGRSETVPARRWYMRLAALLAGMLLVVLGLYVLAKDALPRGVVKALA